MPLIPKVKIVYLDSIFLRVHDWILGIKGVDQPRERLGLRKRDVQRRLAICGNTMTRNPRKVALKVAVFLCLLLYLTSFIWLFRTQVAAFRDADFASFYLASRVMIERSSSDLYRLGVLQDVSKGYPNFSFKPFIHPPFETLVFWPFGFTSFEKALWTWFGLNFLVLLFLPHCASKLIPSLAGHEVWVLAAILSFYPFYSCLLHGQDGILVLLVLWGALFSFRQGNDFVAGMILSLVSIKPQLVAFLIFPLVVRRRMRSILGVASGFALLAAVSITLVGIKGIRCYIEVLRAAGTHYGSAPELGRSVVESACLTREQMGILKQVPQWMHTWIGQLSLLGLDWTHGIRGAGLTGLIGIAGLVFLWDRWSPQSSGFALRYAATVLIAILASVHAYLHDLVIAFLPLCLCAELVLDSKPHGRCWWALSVLLLSSPLIWLFPLVEYRFLVLRTTVLWMSAIVLTLFLMKSKEHTLPERHLT